MIKPFYTCSDLRKILGLYDNRQTRKFLEKLGLKATLVGQRKYIYYLSELQNCVPDLYCSILEAAQAHPVTNKIDIQKEYLKTQLKS